MNIFSLTVSLMVAAMAVAPLAQAAPKGKKRPAPTRKTTPAKPAPKKEEPKPQEPKQEEPAPVVTNTPEDAQYAEFIKRLDEQLKENTSDYCPAMEYILTVENDNDLAAATWMKRASDAGHPVAQHYMANRALSFIPAEKIDSQEVKDAVALLKKSADKGFIPAKLDLAVCQKSGRGTAQDDKAATASLMDACKSGSIEARFKWLLLTDRLRTFADLERPEVKSEVERGNHHITYFMSSQAPDSETQFEMLKEAATKGNSEALFTLSSLLHENDTARSFELLQESAKLHNNRAIFVLGSFLLEPDLGKVKELNLTKDLKNGMHLVKLASMLGNVQADLALGNAYYDGLYETQKDVKLAYEHYKQAYEIHGNVTAAASTGYMLLNGMGVQQDTQRGMALLKQASATGYGYASVLLAHAAYTGTGCEADARKSLEYLQDAAGMQLPVSYVFMAYLYAKGGPKLPANQGTADSYLRMAALDMGDKAKAIYDELMKLEKWQPHP